MGEVEHESQLVLDEHLGDGQVFFDVEHVARHRFGFFSVEPRRRLVEQQGSDHGHEFTRRHFERDPIERPHTRE